MTQSVLVWDIESVPDLKGFALANDLVGKSDDEIREKIFKNYALKSINAVRTKLQQAIFYIERNPETVKSITSFPLYHQVTLMWKWY